MLIIAGRIFIDVKIDGKSIDNSPNLFSTLTLSESITSLFPAATLILNDYSGKLQRELALTDGNEILVTVGRSPDDLSTVSRQYRLYGLKQDVASFGPEVHVHCVYDAPDFLQKNSNEHYCGTSSKVLQDIADKCKLYYCGPEKFNGRSMNDSQSWWNINRTRASFAQQNVARHGYMDRHSAMCAAVTSLGELRYRNLMDVMESPLDKIEFLFVHSSPQSEEDKKRSVYLVDKAQAHSDAGLMNSWQNYGSTRVVGCRKTGGERFEECVDVKTSGKYLAVNDQVSKTIEKARYDHSLLDCGNVSDKYERAFYQNVKQLGLFSERMSVLVSSPTTVQLLDPVLYRQNFADPKETASTSDIYLVIGKTIRVKHGMYYAERLELVRMSLTEKGESALKCAVTPDKAAASALPESKIDPTALTQPGKPGTCARQLTNVQSIQVAAKDVDEQAKKTKVSSLKVAKSSVNILKSVLAIAKLVKGGTAGIIANPTGAIQTLSGATGSLLAYNSTVGGFSSDYMQTGVKAVAYADAQLNNKTFNEAVRVAALTKPGGLAENQAAIAGAIALNKKADFIFNSGSDVVNSSASIYALRNEPGGEQALNAFNGRIDELNQNSININKGLTDTWNGSVSLLSGKAPPTIAPAKKASSSIYSFVDGSLAQPSGYEAKVKSPTDVKTEYFKAVSKKNEDQTYPWADEIDMNFYRATPAANPVAIDIESVAYDFGDDAVKYQAQQALNYI